MTRIPDCHPDRAHEAHGRCKPCYERHRRAARPPQGPSDTPHIPEGHELAGLSTLRGADGEVSAAWEKTRTAGSPEPPVPIPEAHQIKTTATLRRADGTTSVQWVTTDAKAARREVLITEAWQRHAEHYRGLAGAAPAPATTDDDLLTFYPLADLHLGLLAWGPEAGENYDLRTAEAELLACVELLVAGAPESGHALVANLGDFFHTQDDSGATPGHGNRLDVDGRWAKVLDVGHAVYRRIVDRVLEHHGRVTVRNVPGNHDPRVAAELCYWLRAVYADEPRIEIADAYAELQYHRHGECLLGLAHGQRVKPAELPGLMSADRPEDWGATRHRAWHTGHVHHKAVWEFPGCTVEAHRSPAAKDAWHAGRYRSKRAVSAVTYHSHHGEISRNTVGLDRLRSKKAG